MAPNQRSTPPASAPQADLGQLLHARRFSPIGYYLAAAFIFLSSVGLGVFTVLTGKPNTSDMNAFAIGITTFFGLAGGLPLGIKGWRKGGSVVEAYERGMRFVTRSGEAAAFGYGQVAELRRKVFNGMLASLTLVLANGRTFVIDVRGRKDVELINDVLEKYGEVQWEADRAFRVM